MTASQKSSGRYIKVILVTDDVRIESVVKAPDVTTTMIEATHDLLRVLATGEPTRKEPAE